VDQDYEKKGNITANKKLGRRIISLNRKREDNMGKIKYARKGGRENLLDRQTRRFAQTSANLGAVGETMTKGHKRRRARGVRSHDVQKERGQKPERWIPDREEEG